MDIIRHDTAKQYRAIRKILRGNEPIQEEIEPLCAYDYREGQARWTAIWFAVVFALCLIAGCQDHAFAYTDEQYINAIYKAEGGSHAKFAYGIRSIPYTSVEQARKLCLNTVKNNRKRYKEYGYRHFASFTQFLASRYCPTTGRNRSPSEIRLNHFWIKNVTYFLKESI